jgi:hypothetical protein
VHLPAISISTRGRKGWLALLLLSVLAVPALASCSGSGNGSGSSAAAGYNADAKAAAGAVAQAGSAAGSAAAPDKAAAAQQTPLQQRDIVRTATVNVTVHDVDQAADKAVAATIAAGGRADGDNRGSDSTGRQAELVLRVPPDKLSALITTVVRLGHENSRTDQGQDVTASRADTDSRVLTLSTSVGRLRELLKKSASVSELVALESQLTTRESQLESTLAQQRALADELTLASLTVDLASVTPPVLRAGSGPSGFGKALTRGLHGLLLVLRWSGAVLGYALPFLLVVAILVVLGWWLYRARTSRQPVLPEPITE